MLSSGLPDYLYNAAMLYRLKKAKEQVEAERLATLWQPIPDSPQEQAYYCAADELFYGGSAGGGKTDLLLGCAATAHRRAIIFRRVFPALRDIIDRSREIFNPDKEASIKDSYNESLHIWRLTSGRMLEFGAIQHEKDVKNFRGRPKDFYGFDEITEFSEYQYRFVTAWNRSTVPGQRCRIIATGNPPTNSEGQWVIRYWGAWLDPNHPNPAMPGELRWYMTIDGKDVEVNPGDTQIGDNGEVLRPKSRTFIPARLNDNPYLKDTNYLATLNALPEPLRSQLIYGDFTTQAKDDIWQVIPTNWVLAAQERWNSQPKPKLKMRCLGVDVAHGGEDKTVIARLYGAWFDDLLVYPGSETPRGDDTAQLVLKAEADNAIIGIDTVGWGASAAEALEDQIGDRVLKINAGQASNATDKSGKYGFLNLRSQMYWQLREALDPESGHEIALPNDPALKIELCAARYSIRGGRYVVESKDEIKKRLGRSPDRSDAIMMAWYTANAYQPMKAWSYVR